MMPSHPLPYGNHAQRTLRQDLVAIVGDVRRDPVVFSMQRKDQEAKEWTRRSGVKSARH